MEKVTLENYQELAGRTLADLGSQSANAAHMMLGIISEMKEYADAVKAEDKVNAEEEYGDILWFTANLCSIYHLDFKEIFERAWSMHYGESRDARPMYVLSDMVKAHFAYGKGVDLDAMYSQITLHLKYWQMVTGKNVVETKNILQMNIDKLYARYPEKFDKDKAINRDTDNERKTLEK